MAILLNYELSQTRVQGSRRGHEMDFTGATVVNGPNSSSLGRLNKALRLEGNASGRTRIDDVALPLDRFTIRAVVRPVGAVTGRQNIVESSRFPFALFLDKGANDAAPVAFMSINTKAYGWQAAHTRFAGAVVKSDSWASLDAVFDHDTVALFVNGNLVGIQAFPSGTLAPLASNELFIGSWVDGQRNRFQGDVAGVQVIAGAPEDLQAKLEEARVSSAWHISRKRMDLHGKINLGAEAGAPRFDAASTAHVQDFEAGLIMYHDSIGAAFEMHGLIWQAYRSYTSKSTLGFLITDESNATKSGARKSLFSKGGIYWSGATGAHPVLGQIYLDYENMGESAAIGLPTGRERAISGGKEQTFEGARMYHQTGSPRAHEVHGLILTRFLATGGIGRWGFPVTDEVDVMRGNAAIGKSSEFQFGTFYWSSATGAFEVHGDIRRKYLDCGGPAGEFGFPTSDEIDTPGAAGSARMNTFQKGSILWFGSFASIVLARPFKIFVGRVATVESEGFGMGQNDLYVFIRASGGGQTYDQRHPSGGDWGGNNSRDINFTIPNTFTPNTSSLKIAFRFKCMDSDPGTDDHLGTYEKELNAANAWGLRESGGVYNVSFSKVRSLTWSVKPQVNIATLSETEKWWGATNQGTATISAQKYARAYRDVDSDDEWWDPDDWLEDALYHLVVKGLAGGGNCFGMALEGIYARKNRSVFGMPLNRFAGWGTLESEFNIKHCYQVGAQAIWWFVGQFVTGNTHDPRDVFRRSRTAFGRGENPVICIAQNYDFSGAPHCILPVAWRETPSVWTIDILDPNFPNAVQALTVDPVNNTFRYVAGRTYTGGEWSGGRFHYMPYDVLDSRPRTPIWDAILLLLAGTVVIFAEDMETESITDASGRDLDAFASDATARLQRGEAVEDCFFGFKGFAGEAIHGGMLFRRTPLRGSGDIRVDGALTATTSVDTVARIRHRSAEPLAEALRSAPRDVRAAVRNRPSHFVLADPALQPQLTTELTEALTTLAAANREGAFNHKLRGKRNGRLDYLVQSVMTTARLSGDIRQGEKPEIRARDIASSKESLEFRADRSRLVDLKYQSRLGAGRDRVEVTVSRMPAEATRPVVMNIRPGIGGLDLISAGERVEAQVEIRANVAGREIRRAYTAPVEGGLRLQLGPALDEGSLPISRIDRLFGPSITTETLRPR